MSYRKFAKEISMIESSPIRIIVVEGCNILPEYFFRVPASSSGKYHPKYALGDGGLCRHVKAAIVIANDLFSMNEYNFTRIEKDLIIASLILHDGWKQGDLSDGQTLFEHPVIASKNIWNRVKTYGIRELFYKFEICRNIASHMGQWNTSKYSKVVLPTPKTKMQKFVHLCDYLASRRDIEVVLED